MMGDLFSVFDMNWGTNIFVGTLFMWISVILVPFYLLNYSIYWFGVMTWESAVMNFMEEFVKKMPGEIKIFGGAPHLFFSLLIMMLWLNLSSFSPFFFPVSSYFSLIMYLAIPFWFSSVLLVFNVNWRLVLVAWVRKGSYFIPNVLAIMAEVVGIFLRPVTLTCRLCLNCLMGKLICHGISIWSTTMLFPSFSLSEELFMMGTSITGLFMLIIGWMSKFLIFFVLFGLLLWEFIMGMVQTFIFVGLLVFYLSEVPIKVNIDFMKSL